MVVVVMEDGADGGCSPQDAMKAAYSLQIFATTFYVVFAVVLYVCIGPTVASPAFGSLPDKWQKAAYAIAIPNFLSESPQSRVYSM